MPVLITGSLPWCLKILEYFLRAEGAVIMSSAEQKELKQKLFCLYFSILTDNNQLFQGFFSEILLHGIHRKPERQLRC